VASVTAPVAAIHGSTCARRTAKCASVSKNPWPGGIGTPKKLRNCAAMIKRPAPAVKPTMTVCEMKLTRAPSRASPMPNWSSPTISASVSTSSMYAGVAGSANGTIAENTTSEMALVGPEIWCHDEPHSAAITAGIIAQ
jgi:hypothetical protein